MRVDASADLGGHRWDGVGGVGGSERRGSGGGDVTPIVVGTRNGCTPRLFPCLGAIDRWYELPLLPPYPPLRTTGALATDAPPRLILEAILMLSSPILSPS